MKLKNIFLVVLVTMVLSLAVVTRAQSAFGGALAFNETGANQYVSVPNFGSIAPTNETTVEFWAYTTTAAGQSAFLLQPDYGSNRFQAHLNYGTTPGTIYWDVGNITANQGRLSTAEPVHTLTNWLHYALVASKAGGYMRIFTNGVLMAAKNTASSFLRGSYELRIGAGNYNGRLHEFRIWNSARTPEQIQGNLQTPLVGNEVNLLLYYRLESASGTVATNSATATGVAFNGTLVNSPTWVPLAPSVSGLAAAGVTTTTATLTAQVNPNGYATAYYLQFGATTNYGIYTATNSLVNTVTNTAVTNLLSGLTPNTLYHFRVVATNVAGIQTSGDQTFTTAVQPTPLMVTLPASNIVARSATLAGTVNPRGGAGRYYFQYGTDTGYGSASLMPVMGAGNVPVLGTVVVNNLTPATEYHYRIVATNAGGMGVGSDAVFTTPAGPPVPVTLAPTNLTAHDGWLAGTVHPGGLATTYYFQYGATTDYGYFSPTNSVAAGNQYVPQSFYIEGLSPVTQHHFRMVAVNSEGTTVSPDRTFWTPTSPYLFTGYLSPFAPQWAPSDASEALKSVQANDVFYLKMTLDPHAAHPQSPGYYPEGVSAISFSVPSRGLLYTAPMAAFSVVVNNFNPHTYRWDVFGVDSTTAMIFWCRDFSRTALTNSNIPDLLDLTGFHTDGFSKIALYNNNGSNPTLWECEHVVPLPDLNFTSSNGTNILSWVTSDLNFTPTLERTGDFETNAVWLPVTNTPALTGLTNTVAIPANGATREFYRLRVL